MEKDLELFLKKRTLSCLAHNDNHCGKENEAVWWLLLNPDTHHQDIVDLITLTLVFIVKMEQVFLLFTQ